MNFSKIPLPMQSIETSTLNQIPAWRIERWVYLFIFLHVILWTLAPACVRYTLPMDAIEGTIWGHQLEWGYDKNPFMNGWLTTLAVHLGGQSDWMIYLFSQLSVALCFWSVWQLAKRIVPPLYAFIAVLVLASTQYYNLHAIDFNDNTLELGFWSLTTLFYYLALREQKLRDWLLTGLFAGFSMMTKYYSAMLLLPMFLFMLAYPQTRTQFKKPAFYLALIVFIIIIAPHTIWLFSHDFVTVNYAFNRVTSESSWLNYIIHPAKFTWEQFQVFSPALALLLLLMFGKSNEDISLPSPSKFDKTFLLFLGLGPFVLTVLLSAVTGIKLRAGWGQPLITLWGLVFLSLVMPQITRARFQRFIGLLIIVISGIIISYCTALINAKKPSSANFPGKKIALTLEQEWHETYFKPLTYIVGPRWLAGNIAFYSKDQPSVYMEADKLFSPWIDEEALKQNGAIFVWDPTEEYQLTYDELKARFPGLRELHMLHFSWLRNKKMAPVVIQVAFLPPKKA